MWARHNLGGPLFIKLDDGSLRDEHGRLVYCSAEHFINEMVNGGACFICGVHQDDAEFNSEHVFPNWMLRRYGLQNQYVNLPNDVGHKYTSYKIPCCKSCNSIMAHEFESPISELVRNGYEAIMNHLRTDGPRRLFIWLNLVFLKAHLRDNMLPLYPDRRKGPELLSSAYAWEDLHHVHCVARSFYSGTVLDASAYGSLIIVPAKVSNQFTLFDYKDTYNGQTLFLRMDRIAIFAVLNDAGAANSIAKNMISKVDGPLSPIQLREIFAHLVYVNRSLVKRPTFMTNVKVQRNELRITSDHPEQVSLEEHEPSKLGNIILASIEDLLDFYNATDDRDTIGQGKWTSLFRSDGSFNSNSMEVPA
jgi:hypothetical protein